MVVLMVCLETVFKEKTKDTHRAHSGFTSLWRQAGRLAVAPHVYAADRRVLLTYLLRAWAGGVAFSKTVFLMRSSLFWSSLCITHLSKDVKYIQYSWDACMHASCMHASFT
jgi:hypothetical protein